MWGKRTVIVGLGNPGTAYAKNRHNLGFLVVDDLADRSGVVWRKSREKAETCDVSIAGIQVTLVKPHTYMNLSGKAVAPLIKRLNADPARMIVVHDDLDIGLGKVRIKVGGGDGGHKGVRSIADSLRFRDFIRIRIGVGRPPDGDVAERFVLSSFGPEQAPVADEMVRTAEEAITLVLSEGVELARNTIHSRKIAVDVD